MIPMMRMAAATRTAEIIKLTTAPLEAVMKIAKDNGDSICNNKRNNGDKK